MEKIIIAGDFVPQNRISALIETGNFSDVFSDIVPITSESDYNIINLEAPIVSGEGIPIIKNGPNLKTNALAIDALKWAGFNCVTLANNHFYDYGEKGVRDTLTACRERCIDYVGAGLNLAEASQTLYKEIHGKTFGIINCCEHEYSIATENSGGSNPINPIQQYHAISEAKKHADHVIVICHGGIEYFQYPTSRMIEWYRFFIDVGADAVINHHQHCYSGYEIYKGKPIFYGLGNLCFDRSDKRNSSWNKGYLVELIFEGDQISYNLIPYIQCGEKPEIRRINPQIFSACINSINEIIREEKRLASVFDDFVRSKDFEYDMIFLPYNCKILKKLYRYNILPNFFTKYKLSRVRDLLSCESHNDKFKLYIMQLYNKQYFR